MSRRVMFYAQHLLGIGHLKRASLIARGMAVAGLDVSVVLGGREVPGVNFEGCARILLPSVHAADASFKNLLDENDQPIDDAWRDRRVARLMMEYDALRPDVLIIELFPFGRRMFAFELLPLLSAARADQRSPHILCSIRDILVGKPDPERNRKSVACARRFFDRVLVHGDPRLVPIEASFPPIAEVSDLLSYTGYVVDRSDRAARSSNTLGSGEVIVSVGGGAVGLPLLRAALAAKPLSSLAGRTWRLIAGPNLPEEAFAALAWTKPPGVIVERWRDDLPALFKNCLLSISQAGYNTVMDLLFAGTRAVLVPFADAGESEQALRASVLEQRGRVATAPAAGLSPEILAAAIERALTLPPASVDIDCSGVEKTTKIVETL
ncbi:MAG: glycosyl transferase family 28 [Rhodospirillales bacterium]|nr:glycosyl transferase family 28 [Rhodospirillales bacterium]